MGCQTTFESRRKELSLLDNVDQVSDSDVLDRFMEVATAVLTIAAFEVR